MLLRNFYNTMASIFLAQDDKLQTDASNQSTSGSGSLNVVSQENTIFSAVEIKSNYILSHMPCLNTSYCDPVFGTGNTPVSFDDTHMAARLTYSQMPTSNKVVGTPTYDSTNHKWTCDVSVLITNMSGSSQTISEAGFASMYCLLYREVLSSPITLANGASVTYTFHLEFVFPA